MFPSRSLLDILAGRKSSKGVTGEVLIKGQRLPKNYKCASGYVVQVCVCMCVCCVCMCVCCVCMCVCCVCMCVCCVCMCVCCVCMCVCCVCMWVLGGCASAYVHLCMHIIPSSYGIMLPMCKMSNSYTILTLFLCAKETVFMQHYLISLAGVAGHHNVHLLVVCY